MTLVGFDSLHWSCLQGAFGAAVLVCALAVVLWLPRHFAVVYDGQLPGLLSAAVRWATQAAHATLMTRHSQTVGAEVVWVAAHLHLYRS